MAIHYPHKIKGTLTVGNNVSGLSKRVKIDCSGDVTIGNHVIFSGECKIFTHDHLMKKKDTIYNQTMKKGVKISNLIVEDDVFFGFRAIVLQSVTKIPKGTVLAAGAVLAKNPDCEYGIYGGVPAKKIGERK